VKGKRANRGWWHG